MDCLFSLDTDGNEGWGDLPKTGTFSDSNATFHGVFGTMANRRADLTVSEWVTIFK